MAGSCECDPASGRCPSEPALRKPVKQRRTALLVGRVLAARKIIGEQPPATGASGARVQTRYALVLITFDNRGHPASIF